MTSSDSRDRDEALARLIIEGRTVALALVSLQSTTARAIGIHPTDVVILAHLQRLPGEPPRTPGDLAKLTALTTGAITSVIDRLERDGYVRRERDPGDRRKVIVELTGKDMPALNEILGPMLAGLSELCATFTPDQLNVIGDYLEGCVAVMRHTIDDVRERQVPAKPGV